MVAVVVVEEEEDGMIVGAATGMGRGSLIGVGSGIGGVVGVVVAVDSSRAAAAAAGVGVCGVVDEGGLRPAAAFFSFFTTSSLSAVRSWESLLVSWLSCLRWS